MNAPGLEGNRCDCPDALNGEDNQANGWRKPLVTALPLTVRVCIPHYYRPSDQATGLASTRSSTTAMTRSLAVGRCIASLLSQRRQPRDLMLNIHQRCIEALPGRTHARALELELVVCTDGCHALHEVLQCFAGAIRVQSFALDDPRQLPLAARDHLIHHPQPVDLSVYLEDDLVLLDLQTFDKLDWFLQQTKGEAVLMPHRIEPVQRRSLGQLLPDGPLRPGLVQPAFEPANDVLQLQTAAGQSLSFDRPSNPHAGMFAVSRDQVKHLREQELPREGFVSPLETAATLTVAAFYPVLKPALRQRSFLQVEHGQPSYLYTLGQLPHRHSAG